jgi:mRNA interferase MazF
MAYCFGDVVLVPFPFTNQSGSKKRPTVIISSDDYNGQLSDLMILAITSRIRQPPDFAEVSRQDWQSAGLLKPSVLKPVITTIEQSLVQRVMGRLAPDDQLALRGMLAGILG